MAGYHPSLRQWERAWKRDRRVEECPFAWAEIIPSVLKGNNRIAFQDKALKEVFRLTHGYPYFLQEWAYQSWNMAAEKRITLKVAQDATPEVMRRLDKNFFRVRFDRLTPSKKNFLRAMAYLGPGSHRTGDIATTLGTTAKGIGSVRSKLIKKGMIYSPAHGDMAFTVPLFDQFMIRAIPEFTPG